MFQVKIPAFLFFLLVAYVALDLVRLTRESRRRQERLKRQGFDGAHNPGFKIKVVGTVDLTDGKFTPAKPPDPNHPLPQEEPVITANFEKGCPHDGK